MRIGKFSFGLKNKIAISFGKFVAKSKIRLRNSAIYDAISISDPHYIPRRPIAPFFALRRRYAAQRSPAV